MHVCVHSQSCPIPCEPIDYSPPGSSAHGISRARVLEWVAISFSWQSWFQLIHLSRFKYFWLGISQVVEWLRICLATQGIQVLSLVREPRSPLYQSNKAHTPQLLKPVSTGAVTPWSERPQAAMKDLKWCKEDSISHNWDPMQPNN